MIEFFNNQEDDLDGDFVLHEIQNLEDFGFDTFETHNNIIFI